MDITLLSSSNQKFDDNVVMFKEETCTEFEENCVSIKEEFIEDFSELVSQNEVKNEKNEFPSVSVGSTKQLHDAFTCSGNVKLELLQVDPVNNFKQNSSSECNTFKQTRDTVKCCIKNECPPILNVVANIKSEPNEASKTHLLQLEKSNVFDVDSLNDEKPQVTDKKLLERREFNDFHDFESRKFLSKHVNENYSKTEILFECSHCSKTFLQKPCLEHHLLETHQFLFPVGNHLKRNRSYCQICLKKHVKYAETQFHQCSFCPQKFEREFQSRDHLKKHGQTLLFQCPFCPLQVKKRCQLNYHLKSHIKSQSHQCMVCSSKFKSKDSLIRHTKMHNQTQSFVCLLCSAAFKRKDSLQNHMLSHSETRVHQCPLCPSKFKTKSTLNYHLIKHDESRMFKCSLCPHRSKRKNSLKAHMLCHTEIRLYQCNICSKKFKSKAALHIHIKVHDNSQPYQCHVCPSKFKEKASLQRHLKVCHNEARPYQCSICSSKFKTKLTLKDHMRTHNEARPYQCQKCPWKFKSPYALKAHNFIHEDERRFKCTICPKRFNRNACLYEHMKSHNPNKRFICELCGASFQRRYDYVNHKGKKFCPKRRNFTCKICDENFSSVTSRKRHMESHTEEENKQIVYFECDVCKEKCTKKSLLAAHIKSNHFG